MIHYYAIRPLDVLSIRANRSFGASGEHGESLMPPWPSLFAGAFRAAMLGRDAAVLAEFRPGSAKPKGLLGDVLGTPEVPGSFRLAWASLGLEHDGVYSVAIPLPSDVTAVTHKQNQQVELHIIRPSTPPRGVCASLALPMFPVLRTAEPGKPVSGYWLTNQTLCQYLAGDSPEAPVSTAELYKREIRVGIGLNRGSGTVEEGQIYSTDAIVFGGNTRFLVGVSGLGSHSDDLLADHGFLRLGGDGKGAEYRRIPGFQLPCVPLDVISRDKQFRLVMATPGIFSQGWPPERVVDGTLMGEGFSARLVAASIARYEIISGWDIARWSPKSALRVVPTGSVYWFDQLDGDIGKLAEWVSGGIWSDTSDSQRRAEGFNQAMLAAWPRRN